MATFALKYISPSTGGPDMVVLPVLSVKGFDDPDNIKLIPGEAVTTFDGGKRTRFVGFKRIVTVETKVIDDPLDRYKVQQFNISNTRSIIYINGVLAEEMMIVPSDVSLENVWVGDGILYRRYKFEFEENYIRTKWVSYEVPTGTELMYAKLKVEVTGTQAAPEMFTTNAGKLALMENGNSFPAMSLLTWVATVIVNGSPYQDAKINIMDKATNAGSNLTFRLAVSDAGNPAADNKYYCDIIILLQARV